MKTYRAGVMIPKELEFLANDRRTAEKLLEQRTDELTLDSRQVFTDEDGHEHWVDPSVLFMEEVPDEQIKQADNSP